MDEDEIANERAEANRVIGSGAMIAGGVSVTVAVLVSVAHYIYYVPVYRRWSHVPANPRTVAIILVVFGAAGVAAILSGWYLRRMR